MKKSHAMATACLSLIASRAQAAGPDMHRVQAGTPDETGWITADSTLGGFSVRVPIPFNDFTIEETDPSSPVEKLEVVGCKSTEGIKFSASKVSYKSAGAASQQFERLKSGDGLPNSMVRRRMAEGYAAVDISFGDSSARASERAVLVGQDLYLLIVEWPIEQGMLAEQLVPTFFESLRTPEGRSDQETGPKPARK